ncbi:MAG: mandelate racemase/muconate lactonizing enzyme family protein [Pseudomonadota bacterium]|nr:mandelate racemase/muconate lactonizing enzyme family protein [Pseudomonadota bacterium]
MTKIQGIRSIRVSLPFETGGPRHGMRPSLDAWTKMECVMVRVKTSDGLEGWGEAFGHAMAPGSEAVINQILAPMLVGRDSVAINHRIAELERPLHGLGRSGPLMYALSAIDTALWDLAAQRAHLPLYKFLGGESGVLTKYASLMRYGGDTDAVAQNVERARSYGFRTIKLHETTIPAFRAARNAVDLDDKICLDVNCPWTVAEAREVAHEISEEGFHWLEEPIWPPEDFEGLAEVRLEGVPISAGENITTLHEFKLAMETEAIDNLQPSVTKCGGISKMRKIISLAEVYPVTVIPHCFYWGPGYHATAHLAASCLTPTPLETAFITFAVEPHKLFNSRSDQLTLDDTPGLGFIANWDELDKFIISTDEVNAS